LLYIPLLTLKPTTLLQVAIEGLKHSPEHNGLNYNLGKLLLDQDNFAGPNSQAIPRGARI